MENWMEVTVDTTTQGIEPVSGLMMSLGISGLVIEDEADFKNFLKNNKAYWDYVEDSLLEQARGVCRVKCYLPDGDGGKALLHQARLALSSLPGRCTGLDLGTLDVRISMVRNQDWENNWKAYYKPFSVGKRLFIIPEWERETPVPEGKIPLYLNPGLIFGTGSHASTRLCLAALERYLRPGDRVLDLGSGSGILSAAALLLGGAFAMGCDIDPMAEGVARENARRNGIPEERFSAFTGDVLADRNLQEALSFHPADLVLANIVADVILALLPAVRFWLKPGGVFLCSGILKEREKEVMEALERTGFSLLETDSRDGWVCCAAKTREDPR